MLEAGYVYDKSGVILNEKRAGEVREKEAAVIRE